MSVACAAVAAVVVVVVRAVAVVAVALAGFAAREVGTVGAIYRVAVFVADEAAVSNAGFGDGADAAGAGRDSFGGAALAVSVAWKGPSSHSIVGLVDVAVVLADVAVSGAAYTAFSGVVADSVGVRSRGSAGEEEAGRDDSAAAVARHCVSNVVAGVPCVSGVVFGLRFGVVAVDPGVQPFVYALVCVRVHLIQIPPPLEMQNP